MFGKESQLGPFYERLRQLGIDNPTQAARTVEALTGRPSPARLASFRERRKQMLFACSTSTRTESTRRRRRSAPSSTTCVSSASEASSPRTSTMPSTCTDPSPRPNRPTNRYELARSRRPAGRRPCRAVQAPAVPPRRTPRPVRAAPRGRRGTGAGSSTRTSSACSSLETAPWVTSRRPASSAWLTASAWRSSYRRISSNVSARLAASRSRAPGRASTASRSSENLVRAIRSSPHHAARPDRRRTGRRYGTAHSYHEVHSPLLSPPRRRITCRRGSNMNSTRRASPFAARSSFMFWWREVWTRSTTGRPRSGPSPSRGPPDR